MKEWRRCAPAYFSTHQNPISVSLLSSNFMAYSCFRGKASDFYTSLLLRNFFLKLSFSGCKADFIVMLNLDNKIRADFHMNHKLLHSSFVYKNVQSIFLYPLLLIIQSSLFKIYNSSIQKDHWTFENFHVELNVCIHDEGTMVKGTLLHSKLEDNMIVFYDDGKHETRVSVPSTIRYQRRTSDPAPSNDPPFIPLLLMLTRCILLTTSRISKKPTWFSTLCSQTLD